MAVLSDNWVAKMRKYIFSMTIFTPVILVVINLEKAMTMTCRLRLDNQRRAAFRAPLVIYDVIARRQLDFKPVAPRVPVSFDIADVFKRLVFTDIMRNNQAGSST